MKAKEDPQAPHTINMFRGTPPNRKNTLENTPLVNAGAECRNPAKKNSGNVWKLTKTHTTNVKFGHKTASAGVPSAGPAQRT